MRRAVASRAFMERLNLLKADITACPRFGKQARGLAAKNGGQILRSYATGSLAILEPGPAQPRDAHTASPWNMQVADCDQRRTKVNIADLDTDKQGRERIVILGSGTQGNSQIWASR